MNINFNNIKFDKQTLKKIFTYYFFPILSIILLLISVFFIFIPKYGEISYNNSKIKTYTNEVKNINSKILMLKSLSSKNKIKEIDAYLIALNTLLPSELKFSITSGEVQTLGIQSGLQFNTLSSAQKPKSFNNNVSIQGLTQNVTPTNVFVSFKGTYQNFINYVNILKKQKILFVVSNVQIRGNLTINSSEVLNIEVVFFAMPDTNNYIYSGGLNNISGLNKLVGVTS